MRHRSAREPIPYDNAALSPAVREQIIVSSIVEHAIASRYLEIGKASAVGEADANDRWKAANADAEGERLERELLADPARSKFRRQLIAMDRTDDRTIAGLEVRKFGAPKAGGEIPTREDAARAQLEAEPKLTFHEDGFDQPPLES